MKKLFVVALLATMIASCYEDKGNYDYAPMMTFNTHTSGMNTSIPSAQRSSAFVGELFTAYPAMYFHNVVNPEDTNRLEYYWLQAGANNAIDTVWTGRILNWTPKAAGGTSIFLCVVDPVTGYKFLSTGMQLTVSSRIGTGWAFLHNYNGQTDMSFIRPTQIQYPDPNDDTKTITERQYVDYMNYLSSVNEEPVGTNPTKFATYGTTASKKIVIFQDNTVTINGDTWVKELDMTAEFAGTVPAGGFKDLFYIESGTRALLANNGQVFLDADFSSFYTTKFVGMPMIDQETAQDITIDAFPESVHHIWHGRIFWAHDAKNKKFYMTVPANQGITVFDPFTTKEEIVNRPGSFASEEYEAAYIDLAGYGDYNYLFSAARTGAMNLSATAGNRYNAQLVFFFEKDGEIYLQFMTCSKTTYDYDKTVNDMDWRYYAEWSDIKTVKLTDMFQGQYGGIAATNDMISKNTPHVFVNGKGQGNYGTGQKMDVLYFAKGNIVYCMDFETESLYEYFKLPEGVNVKLMELNKHDTELGIYADDNTFRTLKCSPSNIINTDFASKEIQVWNNITNVVDLEYFVKSWSDITGNSTSDRIIWE